MKVSYITVVLYMYTEVRKYFRRYVLFESTKIDNNIQYHTLVVIVLLLQRCTVHVYVVLSYSKLFTFEEYYLRTFVRTFV